MFIIHVHKTLHRYTVNNLIGTKLVSFENYFIIFLTFVMSHMCLFMTNSFQNNVDNVLS